MVQPRVEWSIVGSAVRGSAIGLPVSYIYPLSFSLEERTSNLPTVLVSGTTMEHGVSWDSSLLRNRPKALFALCHVSNPPTLLSTTTREMVIRYGLEVARDTLSLFLLHVSGPCRLVSISLNELDPWDTSQENLILEAYPLISLMTVMEIKSLHPALF